MHPFFDNLILYYDDQNGSEEAERHSVAGKEAERAELVPQNGSLGSESHSVAIVKESCKVSLAWR